MSYKPRGCDLTEDLEEAVDTINSLRPVYDAEMALAPVLAFMGTHSDVHGRERELIAEFLNACKRAEEVERG